MMDCDVIRDLLPLYADDACSGKTRELVETHLKECPACSKMLSLMRETTVEKALQTEKNEVILYGQKRFKRRSALVGAVLSGLFMIPILVCLIVNIASGQGLGWFFIVLASLLVAASVTVVPLMAAENKLLLTFAAFCVSLVVLLGVVCLHTHGSWFFIASSASLFGLAVLFLPFVVKAKPVQTWLGSANRWIVVLGLEAVLFINMMNAILPGSGFGHWILALGALAGLGMIGMEIMRKRGTEK